MRDSAGVRIVEVQTSTAPAPFTIARRPSYVIGESGTPEEEFTYILDALRLDNGIIAVVNRGTHGIRFFDAKGRYLRTSGRRGRGPGEYTNIAAIALLPGDSLLVQDWSTSRVSVLDARGDYIRSFRLGPAPRRPRAALVGQFTDGTLLGAGSDYMTDREPPPGPFTLTQTLFTFSSTGEPIGELNQMLERQYLFVAGPGGNSRYILPFGLMGTVRISGDHYLIGDGRTFQIEEWDRSGKLVQVLRASVPRHRITDADRELEKTRIMAFYEMETAPKDFLKSAPRARFLPAFGRFELDASGRLWVEDAPRADTEGSQWYIFDTDWMFLGVISLPARFALRHIYDDGVLGIARDADGVESVAFYPFTN